MKFLKIACLSLIAVLIVTCKNDDETNLVIVPDRDRAEVYAEDLAEIESFLETHFYNYEDFDSANPYSLANDNFKIAFDTIDASSGTGDKIPLIDQVSFKMITDPSDETIEYKLYYLTVREGLGNTINFTDQAILEYEGELTDGTIFDSAINPTPLNLIAVGGIPGVVHGFRESIIEFKTSDDFTKNTDGTVTYHNHGIGAMFIPSGIGYFSNILPDIPAYTPLIFTFSAIERIELDHDADNIPSYLEDLNGNLDAYDDDTDEDLTPNFLDLDDDGDGVLTINEDLEDTDLLVDSDGDGNPTNDKNGDGNPLNDDTDGDGIPNYLDADSTESNED